MKTFKDTLDVEVKEETHEEILDAEYNDDENDDACLKEDFC